MTHSVRIAGMLARRPSATTTAIGKAMVIEITVSITVSGRPPHWSVVTLARPRTPPLISVKKAASTATHSSASQGFQNQRMQLATTRPSSSRVASSARQCSGCG